MLVQLFKAICYWCEKTMSIKASPTNQNFGECLPFYYWFSLCRICIVKVSLSFTSSICMRRRNNPGGMSNHFRKTDLSTLTSKINWAERNGSLLPTTHTHGNKSMCLTAVSNVLIITCYCKPINVKLSMPSWNTVCRIHCTSIQHNKMALLDKQHVIKINLCLCQRLMESLSCLIMKAHNCVEVDL